MFIAVGCVVLFGFALHRVAASPIGEYQPHIGLIRRFLAVDNSQDAWSDLVSGIAPLVLLIGERVTKQHLRESMTRAEYYMLGTAPFGLITSMVSMLRLASLPLCRPTYRTR